MEPIANRKVAMSDQPATSASLPYLSQPFHERLSITTDQIIDSIEQLIVGQQRGQVWCAPKVVVLPGDERYIMATLAVADELRVVATKSLVLNPRNVECGIAPVSEHCREHSLATGDLLEQRERKIIGLVAGTDD